MPICGLRPSRRGCCMGRGSVRPGAIQRRPAASRFGIRGLELPLCDLAAQDGHSWLPYRPYPGSRPPQTLPGGVSWSGSAGAGCGGAGRSCGGSGTAGRPSFSWRSWAMSLRCSSRSASISRCSRLSSWGGSPYGFGRSSKSTADVAARSIRTATSHNRVATAAHILSIFSGVSVLSHSTIFDSATAAILRWRSFIRRRYRTCSSRSIRLM
jgi:hypothetical protein